MYTSDMQITTYKTKKIQPGDNLYAILDEFLPKLSEKGIVIVTSKIVSICQNRVIKNDGTVDKYSLIKKIAQYYIDEQLSKYHVLLTIHNNTLIANAGIDESNGNGYFIFWPDDIANETKKIWKHLRKKNKLKRLGIIITDSHTTPLRWGTTGIGLAWCGFQPLKNYIGAQDIFGHKLRMTKASILDGLAATAVVAMGEGNEQTPLAVIKDVPFVDFTDKPPTDEDIQSLKIELADDIHAPLVNTSKWKKGGIK